MSLVDEILGATKEQQRKIIDREWDKVMEYKRASWDDTIFGVLAALKKRSHDSQTQIGCALVNPKTHQIIAMGFNGASRDLYDDMVPNTRPEKYPYYFHSEDNALYNAMSNGINPAGSTCYVDGYPCIKHEMAPGCLQKLYHNGVRSLVIKPHTAHMLKESDWWADYEEFQTMCKYRIDIRIIGT